MFENDKKENNFVIGVVDDYVKDLSGNWWTVFATGILFIVFGLIFLIWPEKTIVFIAYTIGLMAIFVGIWTMAAAFKVKRIESNYKKIKERLHSKFFKQD